MVLWELVGDINKLSLEATTKRFVGWVVGGGGGGGGGPGRKKANPVTRLMFVWMCV